MIRGGKGRAVIILLAAMGLVVAASALASAQSYGRLASIEIEGNRKLDAEFIKSLMPLTIGMDLTQEDLDKTFAAMQASGYFADLGARSQSFLGGIKLIVTVEEFPDLNTIAISGNTLISTEQLLSRMKSTVGKMININTVKEDLDGIIALYKEDNRIATVQPDISMDGVLSIVIIEWKVGLVQISGNEKTKEEIIRRNIRVTEGDFIDTKVLSDDSRRIYNTAIFEDVGVELLPRDEGPYADITFVVTETKTGLFNVGATYNSAEGLIGYIEVSDKNVFGYGITVSGKLEAGGKEKQILGEFSISTPYLFTDKLSGGLEVYRKMANKTIDIDEDEGRTTSTISSTSSTGRAAAFGWATISTCTPRRVRLSGSIS